MKTGFLYGLIFTAATCGAANAQTLKWYGSDTTDGVSDYCIVGSSDSAGTNNLRCYWCATREMTDTYCTPAWAGCFGGAGVSVNSGGTLTDDVTGEKWKCGTAGWEKVSSTVTCASGNGCSDGCYWDPAPYTCVVCPAPDFVSRMPVVTMKNGERSAITDCFIPMGHGFQDETGTFDLVGECHYSL